MIGAPGARGGRLARRVRGFGLLLGLAVAAAASPAAAEPLPSGTIGYVTGITSGTGADAKRMGIGVYPVGLQAAWHPMSTERRFGWSLRWGTMFGWLYGGSAARIESVLRIVQMDLVVGVRYRPWITPDRYLTLRAGAELLRANESIPVSPDEMQRAFLGGIAAIGLDQYIGGMMINVDVRYGLIGHGPRQIAVLLGVGFTGP